MTTRRRSSMEDDEDFVPSEEEEEEELQEIRPQGGKKRKSLGDDSDESSETDDGCCGNQQKKGKNNNEAKKKKRRVRYGWACSMCKLKHRSCDGQRPCTRCKNEGFADTCCDGSGDEGEKQQNDNKKKIKQEKLAYTTMIKHKGNTCCVTPTERPLVENCKKEKKQHAQQQPQQHTPSSSCLSQRQLEREILAKVIEFVSLKADALTTTNNTASSIMPAFAQLLQPQQPQPQQHVPPQDFSFQFLAPPRWNQPTPIVEGLSTYIPPSLFPSQPQLSFASFPSNLFLRQSTEGQEREKEKGAEGQGTKSETYFAFPTVTNCMPARGEPKKEGASCASVATPPLASYYGWNSTEVEGFLF